MLSVDVGLMHEEWCVNSAWEGRHGGFMESLISPLLVSRFTQIQFMDDTCGLFLTFSLFQNNPDTLSLEQLF